MQARSWRSHGGVSVARACASRRRWCQCLRGGLDFSLPVRKFFYDPLGSGKAFVDCVVSLTGFALVGGPARQDAPKVGFIGLVPCEIGFCGLGFIGFCVPTGYRAVCVVLCSD